MERYLAKVSLLKLLFYLAARSGSSQLVYFGTHQKRTCNFLLMFNSNFRPISEPFVIHGDLLVKFAVFPTTLLLRFLPLHALAM